MGRKKKHKLIINITGGIIGDENYIEMLSKRISDAALNGKSAPLSDAMDAFGKFSDTESGCMPERKEKKKMAVKENVSIHEIVDFLNELLEIDPDAINNLFSIRVGCNKTLADHPTVQVAGLSDSYFIVGIIGILNGVFGLDEFGWGHITADCEGSRVLKFRALTEEEIQKYVEQL